MAEIQANSQNDISTRGITNTNLANFRGKQRQVVINVDDGMRPIVMDGSTLGGKFKCASIEELSSGLATKQPTGDYATNTALTQGLATKIDSTAYNSDKSTFLTKTDASNTYLGKTAKAESAKVADSATVAQSANSVAGANVLGTVANATNAVNATTAVTATNNILKLGARGSLAGSETVSVLSGNQTITKDSADTIVMNTSGATTLTFTPAGTNDCAVKVISLTATGETTLNISGAVWANTGEAPTWGTAGKHLILIVYFISNKVILNIFNNDEG